jgi:hypothetical protein
MESSYKDYLNLLNNYTYIMNKTDILLGNFG